MDNNSQTNYAGFWIRWFAQGLDILIWSTVFFLSLYLLSAFGSSGLSVFIPGFLWFLLSVIFISGPVKLLIQPLLINKFGGGLGKLACGLEITREDGSRLTYKNGLFREYVAKIASNALLGLGYYWIFKTPNKQGWHDSLSGTYVVKKHNGLLTGIMVLILFLAIEVGLVYKSIDNFKGSKTLQYDFATLITQIRQDLYNPMVMETPNSDNNTKNDYENPGFNDLLKQMNKYNIQ